MLKPIELGSNPENQKQAVFVALTTESQVWKNYEGIPDEAKQTVVPLVLMLQRWDGQQGFIGGEVEEGESLKDAVERECFEEIGLMLNDSELKSAKLVSSHKTEKQVTHLMTISISPELMQEAVKGFSKAEHFMSEIIAVMPIHFINYPHKKAFDNFVKNNFASTVKEEIADLISGLGWDKKYNLPTDFVPVESTQKSL